MIDHNMRWEHVAGFGSILTVILFIWRWSARHVKYFKARMNGWTIEKDNSSHTPHSSNRVRDNAPSPSPNRHHRDSPNSRIDNVLPDETLPNDVRR